MRLMARIARASVQVGVRQLVAAIALGGLRREGMRLVTRAACLVFGRSGVRDPSHLVRVAASASGERFADGVCLVTTLALGVMRRALREQLSPLLLMTAVAALHAGRVLMRLVARGARFVAVVRFLVTLHAERCFGAGLVRLMAGAAVRVLLRVPARERRLLLRMALLAALLGSDELVGFVALAARAMLLGECFDGRHSCGCSCSLLLMATLAARHQTRARTVNAMAGGAVELARLLLGVVLGLDGRMAVRAGRVGAPLVEVLLVRVVTEAAGPQVAMDLLRGDGWSRDDLGEP